MRLRPPDAGAEDTVQPARGRAVDASWIGRAACGRPQQEMFAPEATMPEMKPG